MKKSGQAKPKLRARRALSQNFIIDDAVADRIAAALPIKPDDFIFEVGAGKGYLTERLAATGARIWAVEMDRRMIGMLRKKFRRSDQIRIIHADVLSLPPDAEPPDHTWLVGNLPYGIGQAILNWAIERRSRWRGAVVMLQREVVRRLLAPPGDRDRAALSIWFQARATGHALFEVPPRAFHPPPRVTSSVMWIEFTPQTPGIETVPGLDVLVRCAFAQRRKVLINNLRAIPRITADALDRLHAAFPDLLRKRAQDLSADEFVQIVRILQIESPPPDA
ncbi:MAG TPA: 16S rRNA (adenine(1518)-N(6)/adenine(1519)-N(6))-dimethyltransferase RsmA [Acidobacteriota bacterium]|nr:16S rRNA (adenine(1518)-N(6)/adenine(1519)-N(6))-dimethyltransferase RsmA [Acidobacteriota bacterium]